MHRKTPEEVAFLKEIIPGHTYEETLDMFEERFGHRLSKPSLTTWACDNGIKAGTTSKMRRYTDEEREFLDGYVPGHTRKEITDAFNERFEPAITITQVTSYTKNNKLSTGLTGYYEQGHVPANKGTKGMTGANSASFGPGHVPGNLRPVGSERTSKGYIYIKVRDTIPEGGDWRDLWKMKHRVLWEKEKGPIPEGSLVVFINGDRADVRIENLMIVTKSQHAIMNKFGVRGCCEESMRTGKLIADIESKTYRLRKLEFGPLKEMEANKDDKRHGTSTGYQYGCRCERCCSANRIYQFNARQRRRQG
ncbi:MAG: HNH endonuclease [Actinobacteria bacterium]|nr:HNH endonuclease [Actinomycetota bacterium]